MNLDDCKQTIERYEGELQRLEVDVNKLRFEGDSLWANDSKLGIDDNCIARLARRAAAPSIYLKRLDPNVRATLLQYHLDAGHFGPERLSITYTPTHLINIGSDSLTSLNGTEVINAIVDGVGTESRDLSVHGFSFSDQGFQLDVLGYHTREEVLPGDVVQGGLRITYSVLGEHAVWVEGFIVRLLCANGMTHRECVSRRPPRTRRLPLTNHNAKQLQSDQLRRLAAGEWEKLTAKLQALHSLSEERIEFEPMLGRWLERARLSQRRLMPLLLDARQHEVNNDTNYAAVNALTRVATHNEQLTVRERRTLARLAGLLAFRRLHFCPRCFSVLGDDADAPEDAGGIHSAQSEVSP
jgi:hypothetical protein